MRPTDRSSGAAAPAPGTASATTRSGSAGVRRAISSGSTPLGSTTTRSADTPRSRGTSSRVASSVATTRSARRAASRDSARSRGERQPLQATRLVLLHALRVHQQRRPQVAIGGAQAAVAERGQPLGVDDVDRPLPHQARHGVTDPRGEGGVVHDAVEDAAVRAHATRAVGDGDDLARERGSVAGGGAGDEDGVDTAGLEVLGQQVHGALHPARVVQRVGGPAEQRDPQASLRYAAS